MINAYSFTDVYEDLGITLGADALGCIMLDTEPADTSFIKDEWLYYAKNPDYKYMQGRVGGSHVTLRYGLLPGVKRWHVDRVLKDMFIPREITVNRVMKFDSSAPGEDPYEVIVGAVGTPSITALHNRLGMLPNIATFPDYKPHVTLAYVRAGWYDEHHDTFDLPNRIISLGTTSLNYGDMIGEVD